MHEIADELWDNVQIEVVKSFERLLSVNPQQLDGEKLTLRLDETAPKEKHAPSPPPSPPSHTLPDDPPASNDQLKTSRLSEDSSEDSSDSEEEHPVDDSMYGTLRVVVMNANDLLPGDSNGLSDPFVRLHLCGRKRKTSVKYKTLNPVWNEVKEWKASASKIFNSTLEIKVFDYDFASFNDFLGQANIDLNELAATLLPNVRTGVVQTLSRQQKVALSTKGYLTLCFEWLPRSTARKTVPRSLALLRSSSLLERPSPGRAVLKRAPTMNQLLNQETRRASFCESIQGLLGFQRWKRAFTFAEVEVTLVAGRKLGRSNVFVKFHHRCGHFTSRHVQGSMDHKWEEKFSFIGTIRELNVMPIIVHVLDAERGIVDNFVGSACVDLSKLWEEPDYRRENGVFSIVHVSTKGSLTMRLRTVVEPFSFRTLQRFWTRLVPGIGLGGMGIKEMCSELVAQQTTAYVKVTLIEGRDLMAAEKDSLGASSDPFVTISLCNSTVTSSVQYRTLNPVSTASCPCQRSLLFLHSPHHSVHRCGSRPSTSLAR